MVDKVRQGGHVGWGEKGAKDRTLGDSSVDHCNIRGGLLSSQARNKLRLDIAFYYLSKFS